MVGQANRKVDDRPAVIILPLGPTLTTRPGGSDAEVDMTVALSGPLGELQTLLKAFRS